MMIYSSPALMPHFSSLSNLNLPVIIFLPTLTQPNPRMNPTHVQSCLQCYALPILDRAACNINQVKV